MALAFAASTLLGASAVEAQPSSPTFRVFLIDGTALETYGAPARVGDRLVFNLSVRAADNSLTLQLVNLPVAAVDIDRTNRYDESLRADFYATTRGETDYRAMTAEVELALAYLSNVEDRSRQLELAELARRRVAEWPGVHYHYRVREIQELVGLFDDVISELRIAMGAPTFSLELSSEAGEPVREPLLPSARPRESIELALAAADAADIGAERVSILRAAAKAAGPEQSSLVLSRLEEETQAESAYVALASDLTVRGRAALERGDVGAVAALQQELARRDRQLGSIRPRLVQGLAAALQSTLSAALERRRALDRYAAIRRALQRYASRLEPALAGFDQATPLLLSIRDLQDAPFARLVEAEGQLLELQEVVQAIAAPGDLAGVHMTLVSALRMAREACTRRRRAAVAPRESVLREASAAAAGALLLVERARVDLAAGVAPPVVP